MDIRYDAEIVFQMSKTNIKKTKVKTPENWGKGTICIQAGFTPTVGGPRILPIFQSTTYKYEDLDQVERLFALKEAGYKYTRTGNPTVAALEQKITQLEGGTAAVGLSSGQAATLLSVTNLCHAGDHIVSASNVYGGSYTLFGITLKKYGVQVTFVDPEAPERELQKAFQPNTKVLFTETLGNPALGILDFDKFVRLARKNDVPFIVDNTLATPYLCNPFKLGANIIVHSATKYCDGHATSLGGVLIDGGNYDWTNGKFPELTEPDPAYHGVRYVESFPKFPYAAKARAQLLRDFGVCLSPFNAFLINLGMETLHLRMEQHSKNALALARFLKRHRRVKWVVYPGLEGNPNRTRIRKYFRRNLASGILTFGLKGDTQAARTFVKNLKVAALVVHIGDARTSVLHPATSTHAQMTLKQQLSAGITPDMIRVSVGIEDAKDIIADFDQAFRSIH
jgi:O-acetylhomoserine (thiol)-lyase